MSTKMQEARDKHEAAIAAADAALEVAIAQYQREFHGLDIHTPQDAMRVMLEGVNTEVISAESTAAETLTLAYRLLKKVGIPERNTAIMLVRGAKAAVEQIKIDRWEASHRANVARYRLSTFSSPAR